MNFEIEPSYGTGVNNSSTNNSRRRCDSGIGYNAMTLVMHENGVLVVHLIIVKDENPREEGPSAVGAIAGVEGTCASNPQQDSE